MRIFPLLLITLLVFHCAPKGEATADYALTEADIKAINQVRNDYNNAWINNDSAAVMNTLTEDAVLVPHHGGLSVLGKEHIARFWWPKDDLPAPVTLYTSTADEIDGSHDMAFIRGRFRLEFDYDGQHYTNEGNYLNIVRKRNGEWKLSRLIWNDPLPEMN